MKNLASLRILFQTFAFSIFIFQMQNSVTKYFQRPKTQVQSVVDYENMAKPIIYVCQDRQLNVTKAKEFGYMTFEDFTSGFLNVSNQFSWRGQYKNSTFRQLQDVLFEADYSSTIFKAETNAVKAHSMEYNGIRTESIYFGSDGFCTKLNKVEKTMFISSIKRSLFFIVDPAKDNRVKISAMDNAKGFFGPIDDTYFRYQSYRIHFSLHDSHIYEGKTCTSYENYHSSYGECFENEMAKVLLEWYGCLPPWFPTNTSQICEQDMAIKNSSLEFKGFIQEEIYNLLNGMKQRANTVCLPPCLTMSAKLTKLVYSENMVEYGSVDLEVNDVGITVYTDVLAYDMFSLVVDLGSALGLWLGLSALSIFDSLIEFYRCNFVKNEMQKFFTNSLKH